MHGHPESAVLVVLPMRPSEMRDRRMRLLGPERYAAWRAREDERINRWKTCRHRYARADLRGILGWRVHCSLCWHMFNPHDHLGCTDCERHPEHHYWNDGEGDPLLRLDQELRSFAERNRAPGHPLNPVRHHRHIVYRAKGEVVIRRGRAFIEPQTTFEVYRGRYLLGSVVRLVQGEWAAYTAEKGPGLGIFRKRSHAARALLDMLTVGFECTAFAGLCPLLPNPLWDDTVPERKGPHYCNIARLGRKHYCKCACGSYLDLDGS